MFQLNWWLRKSKGVPTFLSFVTWFIYTTVFSLRKKVHQMMAGKGAVHTDCSMSLVVRYRSQSCFWSFRSLQAFSKQYIENYLMHEGQMLNVFCFILFNLRSFSPSVV